LQLFHDDIGQLRKEITLFQLYQLRPLLYLTANTAYEYRFDVLGGGKVLFAHGYSPFIINM